MKHLLLITLFTLITSAVFCKASEEKTFVVIFSKKELKELKSSPEFIELNFFEKFDTKTYNGNSDAVLFIKVPDCDFDKCQFGQTMVQINKTTEKPLQEVAFRIIDLSESKESYKDLLNSFYASLDKKQVKAIKSVL
ncbi:hypothetical protein [Echinicola salinicaeni]|uniref:hypothetical protein n=1 Tax=Echinicola salinicaeni TaxID=2762757 RepID=UPI0016444C7E|nr:hypothetical protein [Echinicola salinicaeni]